MYGNHNPGHFRLIFIALVQQRDCLVDVKVGVFGLSVPYLGSYMVLD